MAGLLRDLLPDAPREASILTLAVGHRVAGQLAEHAAQGVDAQTAVRLVATTLAASTAFTFDACEWAVRELAVATGLLDPAQEQQQPSIMPPASESPVPAPGAPLAAHPAHTPQPSQHPAGTTPSAYAPPSAQQPTPYNQPAAGYGQPPNLYAPPASAYPQPGMYRTPGPAGTLPESRPQRTGHGRTALIAAFAAVIVTLGAGTGWYFGFGPGSKAQATGPARNGKTPPTNPGTARHAGPDNVWVAVLASINHSSGIAAADSELAQIRESVPGARLLNSSRYASLRPKYWVVYFQGGFTNGIQALDYCAAHGRTTSDECYGRYLSHNPSDYMYLCSPPVADPGGQCYRD